MVVVIDLRVSDVGASLNERLLEGQPVLPAVPAHRYRPVEPVEVVVDVGVGLLLAEERQNVDVAPLVVPPRRPPVIVLGHAAQEYLPVDGAGSTHHAATRHVHRLGLPRRPGAHERPVVRRSHLRGPRRVPELQVVRRLLQVGVVRPCLQQQHRAVWILGQSGGHRPTGRTGAYHDNVILHAVCSWGGAESQVGAGLKPSSTIHSKIHLWSSPSPAADTPSRSAPGVPPDLHPNRHRIPR